jgi:hypothetical protein
MCTGAEIAVIAGTGAKAIDQNMTYRAQMQEQERRNREASELNERAGQRVSQQVDDLKKSTEDAGGTEEKKLQDDFMNALRRSQLSAGGSGLDATPGAASDQYTADAASARRANVVGNRAAATNLARIDAPFMQRVREAAGGSRLRTDLSRLDNQSQGQDFISRLRSSLIQPNAGLNAAGDALIGYGGASASRMKKPPERTGFFDTYDRVSPGVES